MRISFAVLLLSGCIQPVPSPVIRWSAQPPSMQQEGRVAVAYVINRRAADRGGADLSVVGNERSGYGIPYPVSVSNSMFTTMPQPIDVALRAFVTDALRSSGLAVTAPEDPAASAHIAVEIGDFWFDGYWGYTGKIKLTVVVLDPRTRQPRTRMEFAGEGTSKPPKDPACAQFEGMNVVITANMTCNIYAKALAQIEQQMIQAFTRPDIRGALVVAPAFAPPPPPPQQQMAPPPSAPAQPPHQSLD
jgi:hypothetical protein